ncbi:zinc ribbon domain-containing protein [Candidatus Woesearchaeota archaeon]|nr:zinc ribbon domain-containing protein [Candidatus Woesearchaeota archaeon]
MTSIHGSIFIIVGIIIGGISFIKEELLFFRYASLVFLVYGIFKVVIAYTNANKNDKNTLKVDQQQAIHPALARQQEIMKQENVFCRKCGSQLSVFDNFCSYCGNKLR